MKIKAQVTINLGLYMDLRPEITIDTEDYQASRELIKELHKNFWGLLDKSVYNPNDKLNKTFLAETNIQAEAELD